MSAAAIVSAAQPETLREMLRALLAARQRLRQIEAKRLEVMEVERQRARAMAKITGTTDKPLILDGYIVTINASPGHPPLIQVQIADVR